MTEDELIETVEMEIKTLSNKFDDDDFTNAVAAAKRETGFTLPATDNTRIQWLIRRTKRHLIEMLLYEASSKYKFEQINSQMKFDHYERIVKREDEEFEKAKAGDVYLFAGVSAYKMFGTKIDAGFAYDRVGRDRTYRDDNDVVITPSSSDD